MGGRDYTSPYIYRNKFSSSTRDDKKIFREVHRGGGSKKVVTLPRTRSACALE